MVGSEAAASAGVGGWARSCPWSPGRCRRRGRSTKDELNSDYRKNDEKLTAFRNKSVLFKRELRPNEEVTWK
ncbi:Nadh Dehydrogenase [Ubiquinone] 1 Beta Subcomplex Subunit 1 [Manis pentadactyla]|nr:Nadh Dehydrogenase [Ubiquinone] 1 Beta Subcomplex Subunit 1 [Manis pentadactyla]